MFLLDDLFLWLPIKGILAVAEHIQKQTQQGVAGEEAELRQRLLRLRMRYEFGEIEAEEYERSAAQIEARLSGMRRADREEIIDVDDPEA